MKFLLVAVNAKYIHTNLAIHSLKSYANRYSEHIEIAEYTINNYTDDIIQSIYKKKPDAIGFSCYIWNIEMIKEIAKELHKVLPETKLWLGGPEVSYDSKQVLLEEAYLDGVMVGEGEETFLELMKHYVDGTVEPKEIMGITYREDGIVTSTGFRHPLNLSEIPFPYNDISELEHKIIYYETSRGCPYSCSYCLSSIEKGVRLRNMDLIKQELQLFLDHKVPQVKFIDRTFNCNHSHAMEIWSFIKQQDNGITNFHFEISADLLNEEELSLIGTLREGLIQLEIGVQSTNETTIKAIHRNMNLEKLAYAVEKINQGGNVHQHLDLIAGLPFEDYTSFRNSFNDVYQLKPNQLQLGFLKVLKGSQMFEESKQHGILYKEKAPYEVLFTKWISYGEVLELKKIEDMVEVYYNSGQFTNTVTYLTHFYNTPFDMYKSLGDYYETNHLNEMSHARMSRYNILLQYYMETFGQEITTIKELLVYDLYLRENLKTRPSFAEDNLVVKEQYREFYGDENRLREYLQGYQDYSSRQISRLTHLEHFHIDIGETVKTGLSVRKDYYVLFDYQNRHPHTYEANTITIDQL